MPPPPPPKRPIYFQSQFLVVRDFQHEQKYHEDLLRRHNCLMHEWGVVRDGLQVSRTGDNYVISPGSAIDSLGRDIRLETAGTLTVAQVQAVRAGAGAGTDVYVTIAFDETNSQDGADKYPPPHGGDAVTRKVQAPSIVATKTSANAGTVIILARIAADNSIDISVRKPASSLIPRGTNLGDISLDGALSFTSNRSPNPTYPQFGLDYELTGDDFRIRARSNNASVLDTTHVTIKRTSGNVVIGTPNPNPPPPGNKREGFGTLKLSATPVVTNDNLGAYFWNQGDVGPSIAGFNFEVQTGNNGPSLRINELGNVGIGTTRPGTRLQVVGGNPALPATSGKTQSAGHSVRLRGNTTHALDIGSAAAKGHWIQSTDPDNLSTNYPLLLNPNGGNVGVGVTEPVTRLHVVGSGSAFPVTASRAQSAGHVVRLKGSTDAVLDIGAAEKSFWLQSTDLTNLSASHSLVLNATGGNVGIGTTDPKSALHVRRDSSSGMGATLKLMNGLGGDGAKVAIDLPTYWNDAKPLPSGRILCQDNSQGTGHLIFETKTKHTVMTEKMLERMRIDADGNVGIGNSEPKAPLDVGDSSKNTMKAILARLPESYPGTYLGVKAYDSTPNPDKSFAIEHHFYSQLNSAINFHRGGGQLGGYITFDTYNGTEKMRLDDRGLNVKGSISCGGKIYIKSSRWTNRYLSARAGAGAGAGTIDEGWKVMTWDDKKDYEEFTLEMACSRDFKENISDITAYEAMTTLQHLTPVKYDYKGQKAFRQNLGFIAEDMPQNLSSEDGKSISPFEVVPILTQVAKEQQRVIAELQETVRTLQKDMRQNR